MYEHAYALRGREFFRAGIYGTNEAPSSPFLCRAIVAASVYAISIPLRYVGLGYGRTVGRKDSLIRNPRRQTAGESFYLTGRATRRSG